MDLPYRHVPGIVANIKKILILDANDELGRIAKEGARIHSLIADG